MKIGVSVFYALVSTMCLCSGEALSADIRSRLTSGHVSCGVDTLIFIFHRDGTIDDKEGDDPGTKTMHRVNKRSIRWQFSSVTFESQGGLTVVFINDRGKIVAKQGEETAECLE